MGGLRASTERRIRRGEICWKCRCLLPGNPPGCERSCERCVAARHTVHVSVQKHGYSVTFSVRWGPHSFRIGPWLIFDDEQAILEMLLRGNPSGAQLDEYKRTMHQWGVGSMDIHLTDRQYIQLLEAGIRDPRTGYQKRKAKEEGSR